MAIIGIDLGTTNSLGAVCRGGKTELIPNEFGSYLTPSVVSVDDDGTTYVGQTAKERLITCPERTASSFKRAMGTDRVYRLGDRKMKPEELSALVLRSIVEDAERYLGEEVTEAVISVPAYFHDRQRTATRMAGELAGLSVKRIINEPSAAALAVHVGSDKEKTYLVFDFGGGTLDISIVSCFETIVQIEAVAGDNRLGGNDFDEIIASAFLEEHGFTKKSLSAQEYAVLLKKAEQCKRGLTEKDHSVMTVPVDGVNYQSTFTNARLLSESGDIFDRIKNLVAKALRDRRYTSADINSVVLAGGSSRMPLVRSFLRHLFGKKTLAEFRPDEMIARGLGSVCGIIGREGTLKDYVMTDISSFSLGTSVLNPTNPQRNYMSVLIPRNTALPCSREGQYCTSRDNQEMVVIDVYQGEHPYAEDNLKIGDLRVQVPPGPAGREAIGVRFTYDLDGILVVDVSVLSTGKTYSKVFSQETDEAKLRDKIVYLEQFKTPPGKQADNRLMMEKLKSLYEESGAEIKPVITEYIRKFEEYLASGDEVKIRKYRKFLMEAAERYETYDPFAQGAPVLFYDENDFRDEEDDGEDDDYSDLWGDDD